MRVVGWKMVCLWEKGLLMEEKFARARKMCLWERMLPVGARDGKESCLDRREFGLLTSGWFAEWLLVGEFGESGPNQFENIGWTW